MKKQVDWITNDFSLGDEDEIIALMQDDIKIRGSKTVFNKIFWEWKYKLNNAGFFPNWIKLARSKKNNELAGHYTVIPVYLSINNNPVLCAQSVDTLTNASFRSQGIFTGLALSCYDAIKKDDVQLLFGYPNDNSYPGFVNKLGWDHIFDVEELVYILNPKIISDSKYENPLLKKAGECYLKMRSTFHDLRIKAENDITFQSVTKIDNDFQIINEWLASSYDYFILRSVDYLKWRYIDNPIDKEVIIKKVIKGKETVGFYILKNKKYPHRNDLKIGHIMELICLPQHIDMLTLMINDIIQESQINGSDILHLYTHSKQHDYDWLRKIGFVDFDKKHYILREYRNYPNLSYVPEQAKWYVSLGDSDRA